MSKLVKWLTTDTMSPIEAWVASVTTYFLFDGQMILSLSFFVFGIAIAAILKVAASRLS